MALRTPLFGWHVAHGARMVDFAGWDMPVQYTGIVDEHQAVRTEAGLFDISHMGRLRFDGPQASDLLQRLFTNDVASMKQGQARYGLLCNDHGGILDDVLVYRLEPFWLMVVNASNRMKILNWIARQAGAGDQRTTDLTSEWAMIAVQGPRALPLVEEIAPGTNRLRYYHAAQMLTEAGQGIFVVSRTGYTGEDGCELMVSAAKAVEVVNRLFDIARRRGIALKPCGLGARDTLRLEAAMPLYGHELSENIDPFQAGLSWAVKMDKGDFIGRRALSQRKEDPSSRRRVGLELAGKRIAREGAAVLNEKRTIGSVSSGTFAPTLQKSIAMAYVERDAAKPDTVCEVDVRGKREAARVVSLPFYRRSKP